MKYSCINIQGNLITEEVLTRVEEGTAPGQKAVDFGFETSTNIRSEIEFAWSKIKLEWNQFDAKSRKLPASDPYGTNLTRHWMEGFMRELGMTLVRQRTSLTGENRRTYAISHTMPDRDELPVHIIGFQDPAHPEKNTLEIKSGGGTSRLSPHSTVQEYLNVTEHVYGIATNGLTLRLIRDSGRLIKLVYLEFDLRQMLDEDKYSEFTLLYRLLHASRFPHTRQETEKSFLEQYFQESIETGNRIREGLSLAVQESLVALGNGFLQSPFNDDLRNKLVSDKLAPADFYKQLRRLVYRLLFLMVTEERNLVYDPENRDEGYNRKKQVYQNFYSIARLRKISEKRYFYDEGLTDIWQGLMITFRLFEDTGPGKKLGIYPLAGDLFSSRAIRDLEECRVNNRLMLECLRKLNEFSDKEGNLMHINYRALDVEELGSVYEGLLELQPVIDGLPKISDSITPIPAPLNLGFSFQEGTERKTTGSYYTRPELVNELIKSALIPVIEERLEDVVPTKFTPTGGGLKARKEEALLTLKVCDPAAGSGHFLLAAARTIAWYLARVRTGEENPAPSIFRQCLRESIQHCIYGVDLNPDAVELCKLSLWLESHNSGKPLSFLDHKIRCGNSLVGVTDLKVLKEPLPDEAFNPVTGDDPAVCKELKRQNKAYTKTRQTNLFSGAEQQLNYGKEQVNADYAAIDRIKQDSVEAIDEIRGHYSKAKSSLFHEECACNIWTSAFFHTYSSLEDPTNPSSEKLAQYFLAPTQYGKLVGKATSLAIEYNFFHWPLEFPDVFNQGGFDIMLGNPPWDTVQPEEQEFFKVRNPQIVALSGIKRKKAIENLKLSDFILYQEWSYYSKSILLFSKYLKASRRFPLTTNGKLNTYSLFIELNTELMNKFGKLSIIVPTGIATDISNKEFFESIMKNERLESLIGFENEAFIFPGIHHSFKFCLITIVGLLKKRSKAKFCFFCRKIDEIRNKIRFFEISLTDIKLINPNTRTCPIFRTTNDYSLIKKVYSTFPVIMNSEGDSSPFRISFKQGLYNMTSDSGLFSEINGDDYLPLYEAKMIYHYDHRYSTYENATQAQLNAGILPNPTIEEKQDASKRILPRYYIDKNTFQTNIVEVTKKYNWNYNWFLSFRDVTSSISERTSIFSIVPKVPLGNNLPICFAEISAIQFCILLSNFNCLTFDFIARQKVAGNHLNFFILEQLPLLTPSSITDKDYHIIIPRVIELTFVSWDIKPFADDLWLESDDQLKDDIRKQWKGNQQATGGHTMSPPDWAEQSANLNDPGSTRCPLPPFKWDEDRRAVLKAELDAIYAKLYGLTTDELRYILDPQDVYGPDFPGETFRVLKEKEIRLYGEYRTKRLVMEAWESLSLD